MRKLLILPLLVLLTGCVTYYYPETALEDGVYYAEDDPSYVFNSGDYSGVVYYPWSSLDYFYLGYYQYPRYGFVYGYPYGLGFSPWYYSYHRQPYARSYRGNCRHHGDCRKNDDENRYVRDDGEDGRNPNGVYEEGEVYTLSRGSSSNSIAPVRRYVTTAPNGYSGNQGLVVRSNEATKVGKNRLEPDKSAPTNSVSVSPSTSRAPAYSSAPSTRNNSSGRSSRSPSVSSPHRDQSRGSSNSSRRENRP